MYDIGIVYLNQIVSNLTHILIKLHVHLAIYICIKLMLFITSLIRMSIWWPEIKLPINSVDKFLNQTFISDAATQFF